MRRDRELSNSAIVIAITTLAIRAHVQLPGSIRIQPRDVVPFRVHSHSERYRFPGRGPLAVRAVQCLCHWLVRRLQGFVPRDERRVEHKLP